VREYPADECDFRSVDAQEHDWEIDQQETDSKGNEEAELEQSD
jgi:hypothetical protein